MISSASWRLGGSRSGSGRSTPNRVVARSRYARDGRWGLGQRLKNDIIYGLVRVAIATTSRLPHRVVAAICAALAWAAWAILPRERRLCRARLEAGMAGRVTRARVRAAFQGAGAVLADTLALLVPEEIAGRTLSVDDESRAVFRDALAEGRGVVFVSAHLGAWERLAAVLAAEGFPCATVARESYDARLTEIYERLRAPRGVRSIYRGRPGAATAIVRELRAGRAVGFLVDLPSRVPCIEAEVFGARCDIPLGPARIALARRAAVLFGAVRWDSAGQARHTIAIERVEARDLLNDLPGERALVERIAARLDARIREAPEAWLGLYAPRAAAPIVTDLGDASGHPAEDEAAVSLRRVRDSR